MRQRTGDHLRAVAAFRRVLRQSSPSRTSGPERRVQREESGPVKYSAFQLNNHAFEPGLFEPKSPLPGNRIFGAETKRPKRLGGFRDAVALEITNHTATRAIGVISQARRAALAPTLDGYEAPQIVRPASI
jgi:hypothetical protein